MQTDLFICLANIHEPISITYCSSSRAHYVTYSGLQKTFSCNANDASSAKISLTIRSRSARSKLNFSGLLPQWEFTQITVGLSPELAHRDDPEAARTLIGEWIARRLKVDPFLRCGLLFHNLNSSDLKRV